MDDQHCLVLDATVWFYVAKPGRHRVNHHGCPRWIVPEARFQNRRWWSFLQGSGLAKEFRGRRPRLRTQQR